jgi:hypothetical protein
MFFFVSNEPESGTEIDPGVVMTSFPSGILDEKRIKLTAY